MVTTERVLFLGNSITMHPPSEAADWSGNWGMAASAMAKDYVHVLARSLGEITGKAPELLAENIAEFELDYDTYDVSARLGKYTDFRADLAVVAIGENVSPLDDAESQGRFRAAFLALLTALWDSGVSAIVVRGTFWTDETKDRIMSEACAAAGAAFVDISPLGRTESNYARSERSFTHDAVGAHRGDRGMKAIADAILGAIRDRLGESDG